MSTAVDLFTRGDLSDPDVRRRVVAAYLEERGKVPALVAHALEMHGDDLAGVPVAEPPDGEPLR